MKRRTTKSAEPSAASLAEMPELDLSKLRRVGRGRMLAKARRSIEVVALDKRVVAALGGPESVAAILAVLARALETKKKGHAA